jgi:putative membrane protein (TIGR04086 family)
MGRSIGAVVVGLFYVIVVAASGQMILFFTASDEADPQSRHYITVPCAFLGAALGGFMTAHIARARALVHGLALGAIVVAAVGIATLFGSADPEPTWYQLALPGALLTGTLVGAYLRTLVPRSAPPAPPTPG